MSQPHFVICIENSEYPASLEKRKIYEAVDDEHAAKLGCLRVIDESGDSYLYPRELFVDTNFTDDIQAAVIKAA